MIRRQTLVDFLVADGESVAIRVETVYRLSHIATAILELSAEPISRESLTAHLGAAFGEPPDGSLADAVDRQIEELINNGLVTEDGGPGADG